MDDADAPWVVLVLVVDGHELLLGAIGAAEPGDLTLVDALLRLHLALDRHGAALRLREVHPDLHELIDLTGVSDALGLVPANDGGGYASMRSGKPKRGKSSG